MKVSKNLDASFCLNKMLMFIFDFIFINKKLLWNYIIVTIVTKYETLLPLFNVLYTVAGQPGPLPPPISGKWKPAAPPSRQGGSSLLPALDLVNIGSLLEMKTCSLPTMSRKVLSPTSSGLSKSRLPPENENLQPPHQVKEDLVSYQLWT